jgi:hypothetical protein
MVRSEYYHALVRTRIKRRNAELEMRLWKREEGSRGSCIPLSQQSINDDDDDDRSMK